MAFVTLRFHYTIFCRQIQHIFEIFGTLRYKSTRSIRHKSHKPTFTKTFYCQSYEFFCQTEYFPEICGFMQCRRTARFGCAKTREAAASRRFAAVRCADCGACAVAGLHYPRRFAGEALSQRLRRFALLGILARNQKPRARRRELPSRGGYITASNAFSAHFAAFSIPDSSPTPTNAANRGKCKFAPQAHGAFWLRQNARSGGKPPLRRSPLRGLRRVRRGGAALSPPICGRSTIPTTAAFCFARDISKKPKAACPPTRAALTRRVHYRKQCLFGALRGFLNPRLLSHPDKRRKSREVQIRAAGARRVLAAPKRAKRRQAAASPQSAARTAARAPSSSQQKTALRQSTKPFVIF